MTKFIHNSEWSYSSTAIEKAVHGVGTLALSLVESMIDILEAGMDAAVMVGSALAKYGLGDSGFYGGGADITILEDFVKCDFSAKA